MDGPPVLIIAGSIMKEISDLWEEVVGASDLVWDGDQRSSLQGGNFKLRFWVKHEEELANQSYERSRESRQGEWIL